MPPEKSGDVEAIPTRSLRIEALATLPVFFKLSGKRAVVAGGSEAALWKAELLAAAGAHVEVFAESFEHGFDDLAAAPASGSVTLISRRWQGDDLKGAALAVGGITNDGEAGAFAEAARAEGVTVNVIDRPEFCDFQFGAIVNRSPIVVGISTDGTAPVLGQAIRSMIEGMLPQGLKRWAEAARAWRGAVAQAGGKMPERRRFWERFADLAMSRPEKVPVAADLDELLAETDEREPDDRTGHLTIIVVGADDGHSLTLGAVRALRGADAIFYDEAVPAAVIDFARREARRHPAGAQSDQAGEDVATSMIAAVAGGKRVVRLIAAGGSSDDRAGLEAAAFAASGLPHTVISSAG